MSFYFLLLLVFGRVFYIDIWSWKNLTETNAWTGLKDQPQRGAMPTKPHSPATDQQPEPGSFWDNADTASSAPSSSVSRKLLHCVCFLHTFSICFISLSTLHVRLPLVSSSKALPLWEILGVSGPAGGFHRTRWRTILESTNSSIKEKGHGEDLPAPTASHPPNRSSQNNPSALHRCSLWWFLSSPISLQMSRVSELAGGCLSSTSPLPRPRQMVEDPSPAHLCFQPASSEVQIYTCSWLTRSPRVAAIKHDTVRRYSADWLHVERAKIDGGSTPENMVSGKTKNREHT